MGNFTLSAAVQHARWLVIACRAAADARRRQKTTARCEPHYRGWRKSVSSRNVIGSRGPPDDPNPHLHAAAPGFLIWLQRRALWRQTRAGARARDAGMRAATAARVRAFLSNSNFHVINCHAIVCTCVAQWHSTTCCCCC